MMQLRFVRQVTAIIEENDKLDNYITPKKLSNIGQTMLTEIFKRIGNFKASWRRNLSAWGSDRCLCRKTNREMIKILNSPV